MNLLTPKLDFIFKKLLGRYRDSDGSAQFGSRAAVREDALRNERSELFYAEKRGLEKGRREDARKGRLIGEIHAAHPFTMRIAASLRHRIGKF